MKEPIYNQSDDAIREAFERFAHGRVRWPTKKDDYGVYVDYHIDIAWLAWQGAMDLIRREANEQQD